MGDNVREQYGRVAHFRYRNRHYLVTASSVGKSLNEEPHYIFYTPNNIYRISDLEFHPITEDDENNTTLYFAPVPTLFTDHGGMVPPTPLTLETSKHIEPLLHFHLGDATSKIEREIPANARNAAVINPDKRGYSTFQFIGFSPRRGYLVYAPEEMKPREFLQREFLTTNAEDNQHPNPKDMAGSAVLSVDENGEPQPKIIGCSIARDTIGRLYVAVH